MFAFISDLSQFSFLRMALMAAVLASVACGIVGSYVTVRRSTYIAGAIAHCTLGGMGLARYLQIEMGLSWATPLTGAVLAALLAGLLISFLQNRPGMRLDTVLSAVWATGMAIGILFISQTSGYNEDLMSYLFGDILMVTRTDLILIGLLDIFLVSVAFFFQRELDAIAFDEEFARLSGLPVRVYDTVFLLVVALTVVLLVQLVGIILVVALLALPAAAAARITARLPVMILASVLLCLLASIGGLAISYPLDLPAGAMIILAAGAIYLISSFISVKVVQRP